MICRKCGASLPDNAIRCSNCGIKVNMICPECKTLNVFGTKYCKNCGYELIKTCPNCKCSNIYSAKECRKCKTPLNNQVTNTELEIVRPISCTEINNDSSQDCNIVNPLHQKEDIPSCEKEINPQDYSEQNNHFLNSIEETDSTLDIDEHEETKELNEKNNQQECNDNQDKEGKEFTQESQEKIENKTSENNSSQIQEEILEDNINTIPDNNNNEKVLSTEDDTKEKTAVQNKEINLSDETSNNDNNQDYSIINNNKQKNNDFLEDEIDIQPIEEFVDIDVQESLNNENEEQYDQNNEQDFDSEKGFNYQDITVQQDAVKKAVFTIKNSINKHVIAINGPEGCGKTAVLKQVSTLLENEKYISLYGNCTPLSQITSFGFFQDAFLRMMGFPPFINSKDTFIKDFKKSSFANVFNFLKEHELLLFLNIFYPVEKDSFENILENKQQLFSVLEKVIKSFLLNSNLIITIDNFELLDGASYDFIMHLMESKFFNNRLKLFVAYQENKSIQSYFDITVVDENIFETICLKKFNRNELIDAVNRSISLNIEEIMPSNYLDEIIKRTEGNAIRMEQEIAFLFDINYISIKDNEIYIDENNRYENEPKSLEELIKLRINALAPSTKNILFMAAIMGYRFATNILCLSVDMPVKKAEKIIDFLKQELFISPVDNFTCEFKSLTIWKLIYQEAKNDLLFKENSERLYATLKPLILSSNIQKLISCAAALNKQEEFNIWKDTSEITAKLGDTNLYVIAQKQCLKILEEQSIKDAEIIRSIIYEQIGKLLSIKSPTEAITYLANVLDSEIKANNINKIIDVSGYFINSCYLTGNYFGAAEAVDAIIASIPPEGNKVSDCDLALIKTRKLKALLNIGNSEQIINIIQEEILPEINKELSSKQVDTSYKNILIDAWILSNTVLAKAFVLQGNNEVFSITTAIKDFLSQYNYKTAYYITQTDLIEAFANTSYGNINTSNEILTSIMQRYKTSSMSPSLLSEWNLINIINRILTKQNDDIKADLFELAAFTNNINEHFMKNIIKLILGYILKEEGNTAKALTIFNEEITYFAKEKVAIGALLSWALIVKISIDMGDIDKALNTATKALEIAQSPKINNFFFIIYFQQFIAEIYLLKGDLIAVKMYLEKAIMLAKQYNLKYQLVDLYIDYGKYMEEYMNTKQTFNEDYIKLTNDMYNKAIFIAKDLKISPLIEKASKERSSFKTFCQLNSIER